MFNPTVYIFLAQKSPFDYKPPVMVRAINPYVVSLCSKTVLHFSCFNKFIFFNIIKQLKIRFQLIFSIKCISIMVVSILDFDQQIQ